MGVLKYYQKPLLLSPKGGETVAEKLPRVTFLPNWGG